MEKQRCKLCLKSFANGRALGGHMRSHMVNLHVPPKAEHHRQHQLDEKAESASSSSSSDAEEGENGDKDLLGNYGLRENPKKSIRLVDPEFSFAADVRSVVLQDRESETESSKNNPIRRRSKRIRKSGISEHHHYHQHQWQEQEEIKKAKSGKAEASSWAEQEPVSSISDATTEEDVAYCLMMLSRDKWMTDEDEGEESEAEEYSKKWLDEEDDDQTDDGSEELKQSKGTGARGKYKCETCRKVFRSYQALGGHRASHKKSRGVTHLPLQAAERRNAGTNSEQKKTHECPVCFRVFSSGQALGGHKRSHVLGSAAPAFPPPPPPPKKIGELLIDLNLPAPIDEDDISQIELSAVSDAEFVDPIIKH